ncbi:MAG: hypothetical protein CL565_02175 [Alphaproteobacteria bacterium]|nr:hypothetical protein [Alphaproteobacteria bacterium]
MSLAETDKRKIQAAFQVAIEKHENADKPIEGLRLRYKFDDAVLPCTLRRFWTAQSIDPGFLSRVEEGINAGRYSLDEYLSKIRNFDLTINIAA